MKITASTSIVGYNQMINSSGYRNIQPLQDEISYLKKLLQVKDQSLLLLNKLLKQSLQISKEKIILYQNMNTIISSITSAYFDSQKIIQKFNELRKGMSELSLDYVKFYENEEVKIMKQHNQRLSVLRNIGWSDFKSQKDFSLNLQNYQNNNYRQTYIYEIPVEMISQIDSQDAAIQFYPLQASSFYEQNQPVNQLFISQVARPTSQLVQIPVEINLTHQIQVHIIKVQEIPIEMVEIVELPIQILIVHQVAVQIKRQFDVPIELLMDDQQESKIVQMKQEIKKLAAENDLLFKENEGLKQKISYIESSRYINIETGEQAQQFLQTVQQSHKLQMVMENQTDHQFSIVLQKQPQNTKDKILLDRMKTNDQLQVHQNQKHKKKETQIFSLNNLCSLSPRPTSQSSKQKNWSGSENQLMKNNIMLIEEDQDIRNVVNEDKQNQEQFVQLYAEQQEYPNQQPCITQEKHQIIRNAIRQIPIELIIEKEVVKEVLKIQYIEKIIEIQKIVQKLVEVPLIKQITVEVIKQVPIEIIKQVKVVQYQTIVKQVPVQVIVEVLVQVPVISQIPVVMQVQKIVEIPIIREVPAEIIFEKIIEKQIQKIIYEPVQKTFYVIIPVIKEIPVIMQNIIEVPVEVIKQVQKIAEKMIPIIKEIPIQIIHEIPVELTIQHQEQEVTVEDYSTKKAGIVSRNSQQIILQSQEEQNEFNLKQNNLPQDNTKILRQIYQIPVQVVQQKFVDRFIEIERITQIATTNYIQVKQFIEVEKKRFIPIVVQIPVQLQNSNSAITVQNNLVAEQSNLNLQAENQELKNYKQTQQKQQVQGLKGQIDQFYKNHFIVQVPVQCFNEIEKQQIEIHELPVICQIEKIVEKQKIVEVQKIVQIVKEIQIQKIVQVPIYEQIEKIVFVFQQKIVEVPVQVIVQSIKEIPIILETPVELNVIELSQPTIIEVPVQMNIKQQQTYTIIQIPIELQMNVEQNQGQIQVIEKQVVRWVIKEVQKVVEIQKIVQVQKLGEVIELQKIVQIQKIVYVDRPVEKIIEIQKIIQVIRQKPISNSVNKLKQSIEEQNRVESHQKEEVEQYQLKLSQENIQIQISCPQKVQPLRQVQKYFPQKQAQIEIIKQLISQEVQTEEGFVLQIDLMSNIDKVEFNRMESNSEGVMGSMLRVWQIPVELQLDYNIEQMQKNIENKYKQKIAQLNNKFNLQIDQRNNNIQNTQKLVTEINLQKLNLKQAIQLKKQREQYLNQKLDQLQKKAKNYLQIIGKLTEQTNRKSEIIQRQKEQSEQLQQKLQKMQMFLNNPVFQQLPIQIDLSIQKQDGQVQTDDIELFQHIQAIEITVCIQQAQNLNKQLQQPTQKQQIDLQSIDQKKLQALRPQSMENVIKIKPISLDSSQKFNLDLQSIQQSQTHNISKHSRGLDFVKVYDELLGSYKFKVDEGLNYQMVSGIEQGIQYQNAIENNVHIYQVPLEVITEPIIYEVPIFLSKFKETSEIQTQTEYTLIQSHAQVVQLPVQLIVNKQDSDYSYYSLYNRQKIAQIRSIHDKSEKVALTDSDSNIVGREESLTSKQKQILIRDKHYSEYFNSRMIEIPIELELNKDNNFAENFTIVKAFQSIAIKDSKEQQNEHYKEDRVMKMPFELQEKIQNMQYETSFHGYDPNNTMFNDSFQKLRTPSEIAYIIHKSSPKKTKQAQNISIATERANQKIKQYGVTHPDMNKKYAGFEIQQSSFQNITVTREMVIEEQIESNGSVDYKRMQSPNLQITQFNYQDHASAKQILIELQQERNRFLQMYEGMVSKYNKLKNEKDKADEELDRFKVEILDTELPNLKKQVSQNKEFINKLKIENQEKLSNEKAKIEDLEHKNAKLEQRIKNLIEGQQKLRDDSQKIQKNLNNFITNLEDKLYTVKQDYKALKIQFIDQKDEFKTRFKEIENQLRDKIHQIRRLEDQLQNKEYKLQQLSQSHQELRKNIAVLRRNQQIDPTQIYQQEFQRVKEIFQEQKLLLSAQVQNLTHQLEMIKVENKQQKQEIAHHNRQIEQLQQHIEEAQHDNSRLHHIKSQIEYNYITGVKQLQQMKNQIKEKDQLLQEYQNKEDRDIVLQGGNYASNQSQQGEFRIEYLSRQSSRISGIQDNGNYIANLQKQILKYQRMLIEDQQQLQEYQQKVCEYLRDALEKQQETEGLFGKLVEYEGMVNSILVEKVTLQIQNKKLSRAVQMSERKVQALSTKLIEAVRLHYEQEGQEEKYYYYR